MHENYSATRAADACITELLGRFTSRGRSRSHPPTPQSSLLSPFRHIYTPHRPLALSCAPSCRLAVPVHYDDFQECTTRRSKRRP
jgi:hypothetical protein